jgi:hypothetical protein
LDLPEVGHGTQYAIHMGIEKRLFAQMTGQASFGLGWLDADSDSEMDFLRLNPTSDLGLAWLGRGWLVSSEVSLDYIYSYLLFRVGAGIAF